jgi:hypothetical protein
MSKGTLVAQVSIWEIELQARQMKRSSSLSGFSCRANSRKLRGMPQAALRRCIKHVAVIYPLHILQLETWLLR